MEIVLGYPRLRSEFGRQPLLSDRPAGLILDLPPDPSLAPCFLLKNPRDQGLQAGRDMSEHQVCQYIGYCGGTLRDIIHCVIESVLRHGPVVCYHSSLSSM